MAAASRQRVLVLGGGFAGMFAAREMQRRFGNRADIKLKNEVNYFVFQLLLPEVAAGAISTRDAVSPLRQLLPGVKVRQARILDVDQDRQVVTMMAPGNIFVMNTPGGGGYGKEQDEQFSFRR